MATRKKVIQTIRFCTGFAGDSFIARDNVFVCWLQKADPKKQPVQGIPGQNPMI
ncbi:MAG: hypothetical protein U0401_23420 [Anaerolineae bacterium]